MSFRPFRTGDPCVGDELNGTVSTT